MTDVPGDAIRNARLDVAASMSAGQQAGAKAGECYHNALEASPFHPDAWYVEGWAVVAGHAFEHGWLAVCRDTGEWWIIDPTVAVMPAIPERYVPVLTWTRLAMYEAAIASRTIPFSVPGTPGFRAYSGIWSHEDLRQFWIDGLRRCYPSLGRPKPSRRP